MHEQHGMMVVKLVHLDDALEGRDRVVAEPLGAAISHGCGDAPRPCPRPRCGIFMTPRLLLVISR